jgi:pilus assembly protein CpaC
VHKRIIIFQMCFRDHGLIGLKVRWGLLLVAGFCAPVSHAQAQAQPVVTKPGTVTAAARPTPIALSGSPVSGEIALSGPVMNFGPSQQPAAPQPPIPMPPLPPAGATPTDPIPRVIPLEPIQGGNDSRTTPPQPKVIRVTTDAGGMIPNSPPLAGVPKTKAEVAADLSSLIEVVKEPEAEISLVEGQSKIIQSRHELTRIVVANPAIADVELLTDQPNSRLLNIYGKRFGATSLTIWDQTNRSVSFLVRVSLDTKDLETRIRQTFPGAEIKIRQAGPQVILDGQVPDSKTMNDVLQLVTTTLMFSPGLAGAQGGGGGTTGGAPMSGGGGMGGGMAGGGGGGGAAGAAGGGGRIVIINRVTVPGPRQIMLHVKIAEINRNATRDIGVSWLYARGNSIFGSAAGNDASISTATSAAYTQGTGRRGFVTPPVGSFSGTGTATPGPTSPLFGVFDAGHFSLFVDALRSNSLAKILAEPNLVALDGQPARFLVGGMFPFPVPQSSSIPGGTAVVTVQFQRFGTILTFLPQILANDVIRLDVEPVISELNFAQGTTVGTGQVPSITERSARTVVELREGQTLAIAGLLQNTTNASTVRVPGLGDLPIVGPWFSANSIATIETETIVLVTPELVSPLDKKDVTEAPGDRVYQPNDAEFYLLGRIEGKLGREFRATKGEQDPLNLMKHFQSEQQWVIGPHGHAD